MAQERLMLGFGLLDNHTRAPMIPSKPKAIESKPVVPRPVKKKKERSDKNTSSRIYAIPEKAKKRQNENMSASSIAKLFGIDISTVTRIINRQGIEQKTTIEYQGRRLPVYSVREFIEQVKSSNKEAKSINDKRDKAVYIKTPPKHTNIDRYISQDKAIELFEGLSKSKITSWLNDGTIKTQRGINPESESIRSIILLNVSDLRALIRYYNRIYERRHREEYLPKSNATRHQIRPK